MDAQLVAALIAAAVAIASAVLGVRNSRKLAVYQAEVDERTARQQRIREEVLRWANPVLGAVKGLDSRLDNILNRDLDQALHKDRKNRRVKPDWAVSYDYV